MNWVSSSRFWLLASLLLLPLMITNDSLWLDEGDTAMYVLQPDFHAWRERLLHDHSADSQMPLAGFCYWIGARVGGTHEWQIRSVNLLWGALALLAMSRVGRRLQLPWLPLLLAIQPYFWFYQNEARPYALQLALGAWLLAALVEFHFARAAGTAWAWLLAGAAFFLFCATLLAPLTVAAVIFAGMILMRWQGWKIERKAGFILAGVFAACLLPGIYYVTTLLHGAKGAQAWHVDLKFIVYVFYELAGMGGIGLSGLEIRSLARAPHLAHELMARLPQLMLPLLLGALLAAVLGLGLRRQWQSDRRTLLVAILLVPLATALVFIPASLLLQKAFWARHYAPVFPFYVTLLGLAFTGLVTVERRWLRPLPVILCGLLVWSSLNFRYAPSLRKEDYRSAAAFARPLASAGHMVWWAAGIYPAEYYGLQRAGSRPEPGKIFAPWLSGGDLRSLPLPAAIVLSRPDVHDADGVVRDIIADNHFGLAAHYQGFEIYTNAAAKPRT